jgi:conjugal transfer pilus assembly protein TraB
VAANEKPSSGIRVYLPPGSILTGTLLTGLDAPTGQAARRDPFPVVVRIQKEAILPNYFRADVRECFLLMSGYGDLSSERAYLRGEAFSCVRADGKVIDTPLPSYAAGEDGKAGVRGRLVSKQGAMIARAMVAGFLDAFSSVFQRAAVPTINLSSGDSAAFQRVLSSASLQTGAIAGVGKALDRLAQYYIDMAEQMFPVIEVDAGRQIDVITTGGTALKLSN